MSLPYVMSSNSATTFYPDRVVRRTTVAASYIDGGRKCLEDLLRFTERDAPTLPGGRRVSAVIEINVYGTAGTMTIVDEAP